MTAEQEGTPEPEDKKFTEPKVSDFDPGEGWRELPEGQSANGREFVVHGWLKHPYWSFHSTRTWVRIDEDEDDEE